MCSEAMIIEPDFSTFASYRVALMSKWCFSSPIPAFDQQGEANQQEQPR